LSDRRKFIKLSASALGVGFLSLASQSLISLSQPSNEKNGQSTNRPKFGMVIDAGACIGCRQCVYACIEENNIGRESNIQWLRVFAMEHGTTNMDTGDLYYEDAPLDDKWYLPTQCMQCENPPCVDVCPIRATWQDPDGIVVIDYDKCMGCRICMAACPYWARHYNWKEPDVPANEVNPKGGTYGIPFANEPIRPIGVVEKCTFCNHRTREGLNPRCVEECPMGARHFGDFNDPESEPRKLIDKRKHAFQLKEHLGTEPRIYYVE
jgi:molybdopterin-containing oxidoreductase family iron-sulfur binding subunit